jgi:peptidoglycan/LPS O-acetylase OafA/YrhL
MANVLQVAAVIGVVLCVTVHFDGAAYFLNHLFAALLIIAFASEEGVLSRAMSVSPLQWLGKLSFSLYMIHAVIMLYLQTAFYALERLTGDDFVWTHTTPDGAPRELISLGPVLNDVLMISYLGMVILGAALVHQWVEEPSRLGSAALAKRYQRGELKLGLPGPAGGWIAALKRRWTGLSH